MKRMSCLLVAIFMTVVLCGFSSYAFAGPCAHDTKEWIMQIKEGPIPDANVHRTYYYDVYVCVFCGETLEDVAAVDVDGHTFQRDGHEHISYGIHKVYYSCFCGATHTESLKCYGPPCDVNYFGQRPDEVVQ